MYTVAYPPADLAPYVRFFWSATAGTAAQGTRARVVPDGCCELIVHFGDPFCQVDDLDGLRMQPQGFLFGQLQKAMLLAPSGRTGIVAVRFRPAGVNALLGIDARAPGEAAVPLADIFGSTGQEAIERIVAAGDIDQGWALLTALLRRRKHSSRMRVAGLMEHVACLLTRPGASVGGTAQELSFSPRSIERRFAASVGLTPRHFMRIARVDSAARLLRAEHQSLSAVAHASGYADQAHFSREFRALVGITPGEYVRELGHEHAAIVP